MYIQITGRTQCPYKQTKLFAHFMLFETALNTIYKWIHNTCILIKVFTNLPTVNSKTITLREQFLICFFTLSLSENDYSFDDRG